jgi:hypothetical protein
MDPFGAIRRKERLTSRSPPEEVLHIIHTVPAPTRRNEKVRVESEPGWAEGRIHTAYVFQHGDEASTTRLAVLILFVFAGINDISCRYL